MSSFELTAEDEQVTDVFLECLNRSEFRFWDSNAPYDQELSEYDWDKANEFWTEFVFIDNYFQVSSVTFKVRKALYQHLDELVWLVQHQDGLEGGNDLESERFEI